jgi:acetaldehyde dehydrogenase
MGKIPVAILGTGNIGSDLLVKISRSQHIECALFAGRNKDSKGIEMARRMGIETSYESIAAMVRHSDRYDIVFDATSADAHLEHGPVLKKLGKCVIDMTPSHSGWMCIPALNISECADKKEIDLITCGGQASIPIAHALMQACPGVEYIEVVTSIASKSAGPATRSNIDEYVETTQKGILSLCGVKKAKAILNLNPANPPINMHNTVYAELAEEPDMKVVREKVHAMVKKVQAYVPGCHLKIEPVFETDRLTVISEVTGLGDYLPKYAGNLDIMTCAAIAVAEECARRNGRRD